MQSRTRRCRTEVVVGYTGNRKRPNGESVRKFSVPLTSRLFMMTPTASLHRCVCLKNRCSICEDSYEPVFTAITLREIDSQIHLRTTTTGKRKRRSVSV